MFAIIETSGKQYKIEKGTILEVDHVNAKEGENLTLNKVLLISDPTATKIGTPLVDGAFATAKILNHSQGDKIIVFKMEAKKRYKKTQGHRQQLTSIEITDIKASGATKSQSTEKSEEPAKVAKSPKPKAKVASPASGMTKKTTTKKATIKKAVKA